MRVAFPRIDRNTNSRSPGDFEMRRKTSEAAVSRSSASSRSRLNSATFASLPATEELRRRTAFGALRRFSVVVLRRCDFADLPLALERRLIAFPKAQDKALQGVRLVCWRYPDMRLNNGMLTATAPAASLHGRGLTTYWASSWCAGPRKRRRQVLFTGRVFLLVDWRAR